MRLAAAIAIGLVIASCGGNPTTSSARASGARAANAAKASPVVPATLASSYGILMVGDNLELVGADGIIAASVPVGRSSFGPQGCGMGAGAWTLPAVSASASHVYFRYGDTKIRMLVPPSAAVDVTTVPGGPTTVSGFSVSPDDRRIAVAVEDLSGASSSQAASISLRLYVEDLRGGGNHADIYSVKFPAGKAATMLWPMGWHQGRLVLAVWDSCTFENLPYPRAWHVVDAGTAIRRASIGSDGCIPSAWPSPAGVACFDPATPGRVRLYDWEGGLVHSLTTGNFATEVSPAGDLLAVGTGGIGAPFSTTMVPVGGGGSVTSPGHTGCLWIDESHVLAPDAVIGYPSGSVTQLPQGGCCAGRFPGGL